MKELVFDDGKAPALTISSAVRTSETEGSVTFTASKAGTYYYQLDGEPASAADIMKDEAKAELVRGVNTISLRISTPTPTPSTLPRRTPSAIRPSF